MYRIEDVTFSQMQIPQGPVAGLAGGTELAACGLTLQMIPVPLPLLYRIQSGKNFNRSPEASNYFLLISLLNSEFTQYMHIQLQMNMIRYRPFKTAAAECP